MDPTPHILQNAGLPDPRGRGVIGIAVLALSCVLHGESVVECAVRFPVNVLPYPWLSQFAGTVPLLKPMIIFVVLTTMIGCFQIFDEPLMIFSTAGSSSMVGGPEHAVLTGVWMIFDTAFGNILRFGYGATVAYGLFVFIAILTIGVNRLMQRREDLW